MTVTPGLLVFPGAQPSRDRNGKAVSAELRFYQNLTTTPATVYADSGLTTPHPWPIQSNDAGAFALIWADVTLSFSATWSTADGQSNTLSDVRASLSATQTTNDAAAANLAATTALLGDAEAITGAVTTTAANVVAAAAQVALATGYANAADASELSAAGHDTSAGGFAAAAAASAAAAANVVSGAVPATRKVTGAGLATQSGTGVLSADVAITVPIASTADAQAGSRDDVAMTPLKTFQAIGSLSSSFSGRRAISGSGTIVSTDKGKLLECSGAGTLAITAAATLTQAFSCWVRNVGPQGDVVLDPNASEAIEGSLTNTLRPGDTGYLTCDGTGFFLAPGYLTETEDLALFGDGSDGNVTIAGAVTLTRDMAYNNLTLSAGAVLNPAGWRIFVRDTLDLTNAPAGAIQFNGTAGSNAASQTGGAAAATQPSGILSGNAIAPGIGGAGSPSATAGQYGTGGGNSDYNVGGSSGLPGRAGSTPGFASLVPSISTSTPKRPFLACVFDTSVALTSGTKLLAGGASGYPGLSGASDNINGNNGGGGGGSPSGGGPIVIFARTINRGASTAVGAIQTKGAKGGNGDVGTYVGPGGSGGGSGAAGSGGGWVWLLCRFLKGASAASAIDVSGGAGGNGGAGTGTGTGGAGGGSGEGGRVQLWNLSAATLTETTPLATVAGSTTATISGAAGAGVNTSQVSL